jgi:tRNA A-37 threonylcarbamoyl transferase component Bud32
MTKWIRTKRVIVAGQAEIWLVCSEDDGKRAIMKKLLRSPQLENADAELRRFQREVRSQNTLDHPGIMPILGSNFSVEPPFYIMPEAENTLEALIIENPNGMDPDDAAEIMLAVIDAVQYAHEQNIYHRDLKPANILLVNGAWVVGDFGMCRDLTSDSTTITQPNTIVGTVAYMAPEQFDDGHEVGSAADIYALAKVFVHMLTGKRPFPYSRLDLVPAEYRYTLTKALAEDPADRYSSVSEFGRQIEVISGKADSLISASDRAKGLLASGLKGDTAATGELLDLVLSQSDDEALYTSFVAKLPEPMLAAMQAANQPAFEEMIRTFDGFSEGGLPFNYVDVVADFFAIIFRIAENQLIRRLALHRIMVVGHDHSRFYVGDVFARLVAALRDPGEILMAADVLSQDRQAAGWYADYFKAKSSLPGEIRDIIDGAA